MATASEKWFASGPAVSPTLSLDSPPSSPHWPLPHATELQFLSHPMDLGRRNGKEHD